MGFCILQMRQPLRFFFFHWNHIQTLSVLYLLKMKRIHTFVHFWYIFIFFPLAGWHYYRLIFLLSSFRRRLKIIILFVNFVVFSLPPEQIIRSEKSTGYLYFLWFFSSHFREAFGKLLNQSVDQPKPFTYYTCWCNWIGMVSLSLDIL